MSEECKWGSPNCKYCGEKCYICFSENQFYVSAIKQRAPKKAKETGRKGSQFEAVNVNNNNMLLGGGSPSRLTANSGATDKEKGDSIITGYIEIMEELKEQNSTTAKGAKTFTIHKEWLDKLEREAKKEHKEFWYLKFCFSTQDAINSVHYSIIGVDVLMCMIKTMWEDRKKANNVQKEIDVHKTRAERAEVEIAYLKARIAELEAQIAFANKDDEI